MSQKDDEHDPHPDMTPMIDIVFQLLIFFLVSMKFKTLDMKIDAFLPKDRGLAKTITKLEEKPKAVAVLKRKRGETITRVKLPARRTCSGTRTTARRQTRRMISGSVRPSWSLRTRPRLVFSAFP